MYIRWFKELTIKNIPEVGGKTASLGEMYSKLTKGGIKIPNGFAITADAYWRFLEDNKIDKKIKLMLKDLDVKDVRALSRAGAKVRQIILSASIPADIAKEIKIAYKKLKSGSVAVRSSATAEDLPGASFAGQQETYLNVKGEKELLTAVKKCVASLFTDRAISYREAKGFDHTEVALSVCVQEMVRSDLAASGVMFTLDTESGFAGVVLINAAYGLGENIVKGRVVPDQFYVFKAGIKNGYKSIISRRLGSKESSLVYAKFGTVQKKVNISDQRVYCLTEDEVIKLAKWGVQIEKHYGRAMDIEWAKDGATGELFIVQARSETVKSQEKLNVIENYKLTHKGKILVEGAGVGQKIGQGRVRVINSPKQMKRFKAGEVLVTRITDPDWEPVMRIASAIVTEQGGKTSHAAIVSRELGVPCIVGATKARQILKNGDEVTVSSAEGEVGRVYKGRLPFTVEKFEVKKMAPTRTKIMMNVADPDQAFSLSAIPNDGVGLCREEFIFTNFIKIHPLALVHYDKIKDKAVKNKIDALTIGYTDKKQFCVDKLAEGMAFIAASFSPHDVIVRLSDFKTNEYATLIGGAEYEPKEENPMLGWRGASRYYDPKYKPGFALECAALKKVREVWGLKNIIVMVPFCRTVEEGKKVLATMKEFGLERGKNGLQVYVMCEIPSNVILVKEFAEIFDGFSIGSNDLTQLTLGVDRDSALVSHVYDENNLAVKKLIRDVIQGAHKYGRKVGICGQAPSDYPEFAEFLVAEGIDSISLNPDTVLKTRLRIAAAEKKVGVKVSSKRFGPRAAHMALSFLGIIGLSLYLVGASCQISNSQTQVEATKQAVEAAMPTIRSQLREEIMEQLKKEEVDQKSRYFEDGFVKINFQYPRSWYVEHTDNMVRFIALDGNSLFGIRKVSEKFLVPANATSSQWMGYDTKEFFVSDTHGDTASQYMALAIYPYGYKKPIGVIELFGTVDKFDQIRQSFEDFKIKK